MKTSLNCLLVASLLVPLAVHAQMPHDAIYMSKKNVCIAGMYGHSAWNQYWEGTLKRENLNIGTQTTQSVSLMPVIGITNRVNVILNVPYVWTSTSAGNLMGQKGVQDLSAWLKVKAINYNGFSLNAVLGGSIPVGNYVADFLPLSIGLQARAVSARLLASYKHPQTGLYLTAHGTHSWRANIHVDRDAYYAGGRLWSGNEVSVPNAFDGAVRLGMLRRIWQTEVFAERYACLNGDNVRRNDMPLPTNKVEVTQVGWYGKIQPRNVGLNARVSYVTDGLNVGQSTNLMVGVLYQFKVN